MANEIWQSFYSASTLYALIRSPDNKYIYDVGDSAMEAIGTWNDARADECDIPMTASGNMHFADFPFLPPGTYLVQIVLQAGANPDSEDWVISQGIMEWDGTAEIKSSGLDENLTDIEGKIDSLQTANNTQRNVFESGEKTEKIKAEIRL
jgi:hypothetical protein